MQRGLKRSLIVAMLVAAAAALPHVASAGDATTSGEPMGSTLAEFAAALDASGPPSVGPAAVDASTSSTTTTVVTPEDICAELGGPDCLAALAECDALGPNACVQLVQCLGNGIATGSAYFPFSCWPDELGDPAIYLCRVLGCPGDPPSFCADPDVARAGWCGPDGELLQPGEGTTTTVAPSTTAAPTTSTSTPTTAPTTTAAPPTTSAPPTTTAPTTTAAPPTTSAPPTTTAPPTTSAPTTTAAPPTTAAPTTSSLPPGSCDPNYDGQCVPIAASVDCADIAGFDVIVVGEDIHGLDGDDDGIGCESPAVAQVAGATTSRGSGGSTGSGGADLALTGSTTTPLLVGGLLLLIAGLALVTAAATTGLRRRPAGYTYSSVDGFGFPTSYRVSGGRSARRSGGRRTR